MSGHSAAEIDKHVRVYQVVFVSLLVLTVVTWWVASLPFSVGLGVFIALAIATFKAGLVASFFMHLVYEKKIIFGILVLTFVFFAVMMILILGSSLNTVHYEF